VLRAADPESVALFSRGLEDPDPQIRLASVKALAQVSARAGPPVENWRRC
jgi:HEAT repeat protein